MAAWNAGCVSGQRGADPAAAGTAAVFGDNIGDVDRMGGAGHVASCADDGDSDQFNDGINISKLGSGVPAVLAAKDCQPLRMSATQWISEQPVGCRKSTRTQLVTPPAFTLIEFAVNQTNRFLTSRRLSPKTIVGCMRTVCVRVNPYPASCVIATPLWDCTVCLSVLEGTAAEDQLSPYTPALSELGRVNPAVVKLLGQNIARVLRHHPHRGLLANGASFGFTLLSDGRVGHHVHGNPSFNGSERQQVSAWIAKQREEGRMVELDKRVVDTMRAYFGSATAVATKAGGTAGEIRVCHNMSSGGFGGGVDESVNASINYEPLEPLQLLSIADVVTRVRWLRQHDVSGGRKIVTSKIDLKQFFRLLGLRRRDYCRVAQQWEQRFFVHHVFSFGGRSAPHICCALSNAISDLMSDDGFFCRPFVDDFVVIDYADRIDRAIERLRYYIGVFGLTENVVKYEPPSLYMVIIGVYFDLDAMTCWVAPARARQLQEALRDVSASGKVSSDTVSSLVGKLQFLAPVVPFAACHLAPFWSLLRSEHMGCGRVKSRHRVTMNVRLACEWWCRMLDGVIPVTNMLLGIDRPIPWVTQVSTDAAGGIGYGGVSVTHRMWMQGVWTVAQKQAFRTTSGVLELAAIMFMVVGMASLLSGKLVVLECDNTAAVWAVNKQHSRHVIMSILSSVLCSCQEHFKFLLICKHIPGVRNIVSDQLSRGVPVSSCKLDQALEWSELQIPDVVLQLFENVACIWLKGQGGGVTPSPNHELQSLTSIVSVNAAIASSAIAAAHLLTNVRIPWIPYRDYYANVTLTE
jgi:hypothetical protein